MAGPPPPAPRDPRGGGHGHQGYLNQEFPNCPLCSGAWSKPPDVLHGSFAGGRGGYRRVQHDRSCTVCGYGDQLLLMQDGPDVRVSLPTVRPRVYALANGDLVRTGPVPGAETSSPARCRGLAMAVLVAVFGPPDDATPALRDAGHDVVGVREAEDDAVYAFEALCSPVLPYDLRVAHGLVAAAGLALPARVQVPPVPAPPGFLQRVVERWRGPPPKPGRHERWDHRTLASGGVIATSGRIVPDPTPS